MFDEKELSNLIDSAKKARQNAYAPYSGYRVGAALLSKDGRIYIGCNVENASFGVTNCAERTALFSAIACGRREFQAIALVGGKGDDLDETIIPCGVCCQALSEFCTKDFPVILIQNESYRTITLGELFPHAFSCENLTE